MKDKLFNIAGEKFFFDLERISEFIRLEKEERTVDDILNMVDTEDNKDSIDNEKETIEEYGQMIDITKWELTKVMIETVLSEHGILDEDMGISNLEKQLSIPFRISFNTLLINKILKKNG